MKIPIKSIIYLSISVSLFLFIIYLSYVYTPSEISTFISQTGILAPLIYIFVQVCGQIFAPISTSAFFVASYIMFGKTAILYTIIIWLISSATNFYISRKYGKRVLRVIIGDDGVKKIEDIAKRIDIKRFYILRISTFFINDFTSYAFGLSNISFKQFYLATLVSLIPWSILTFVVMKEGDSIILTTVKILLTMVPFLIVSYIYMRRIQKVS